MDFFTDKNTASTIRSRITKHTHSTDYYNSPFDIKEDHGTMHISVIDKNGSAVSLTSTINLLFGSRLMDPITGIILNDEMDDFSIPDTPNAFGLFPSPYNYIRKF